MNEEKMDLIRICDCMYQRWEEDVRELHRFLGGDLYEEYHKIIKKEQQLIQEIKQNL